MRTNFDFSPYRRSTIGFDRLFDMLESNARNEADAYPPFDIEEVGDEHYQITLAVAGFRPADIELIAQNNQLTVTGKTGQQTDTNRYLQRGIATRAFERRFQLADFVIVREARFDNGLLRISLQREVPETMKPRRIDIVEASSTAANDRLDAAAFDHQAA